MRGTLKTDRRAEELIEFWFGGDPDDGRVALQQRALWFEHNPAHDREITARFSALLREAESGALDSWGETPNQCLALIILLDQFSRVVGRGTPHAFENDPRALALSRRLVEEGAHKALRAIERVFVFLPFEHTETAEAQRESVALCEALAEGVPPRWREAFDGFSAYARKHAEVIRRFGRFPHRNEILGRVSTPEERQFLLDPEASF